MNLKEFLALWERYKNNPVGIIGLFALAVLEYEKNQELGEYMVSYLLHPNRCIKDPKSPSGCRPSPGGVGFHLKQFLKDPNIIRSYIGGTPQNNYTIGNEIKLNVLSVERVSQDEVIVTIKSSGKDFPTRITLKYVDGAWRIYDGISSMSTGVRPPQ